ncbi:MAG: hypothetical protein AB7F74_15210 [Parvibaculaceae bacterium]
MPRNGSGIYGPPAGTMATPNTPIESAKYNTYVADNAEAMTNSINVNGTAPWQANQPMAGFKFINLGAGAAASDSTNLGQAQSDIVAHAVLVGGTADAITATFSPAFTAYAAKMRFRFTAASANTIVNPTINIDGLGAKTIKKLAGAALAIGDIAGAGHACDCLYNGTDVILLNFAPLAESRANTFTAKQTFNGPVVKGTTVLADAATIAWDLSTGADFKVTITSNRVLAAFTNGTSGQEGMLTVAQDGVGGWNLDLSNAVYDFWGPSIENIARGPNDETVYEYKVVSAGSMFLRRKGATSIGYSGRDLLDAKTASASATIDFVLTKWLHLYDRFEIDYDNIQPATDATELRVRTSTNGGSSYDAGTSDYAWGRSRQRINVWDNFQEDSDLAISLIGNDTGCGLSNVAGETCSGTLVIYNPSLAQRCKMTFYCVYVPESAASTIIARTDGWGVRLAAADVDAVRFLCSSGNIASGIFRLFGIRK